MFFKKFKKALIVILLTLFIIPNNILAYSDYIIAGGDNIGIELKAKGIMIVGTYKIKNENPASKAGLKIGDIIKKINNIEVTKISEMVNELDKVPDKSNVLIHYTRDDILKSTKLSLINENNTYKSGLYVKDSITGIGTLTFIDPNTKLFGALGHEIIEKSTGQMLEIKDGKIFNSEVTNIIKSENDIPGEKNAKFYSNQITGDVFENTEHGIFGNYKETMDDRKLYKVVSSNKIKLGNAKILTVLNQNEIKEYDISILKINKNSSTKNLLFEIIDEELLNVTGGIVQGMSGSPIIQGENIIGAVTHVVIKDPTKGYGIFITNMLEEAEN